MTAKCDANFYHFATCAPLASTNARLHAGLVQAIKSLHSMRALVPPASSPPGSPRAPANADGASCSRSAQLKAAARSQLEEDEVGEHGQLANTGLLFV